MTAGFVILILVLSVLLFIAEVFLLPSGILGKLGFITAIVGLFFAYYIFGFTYGSLCVIMTVIINGALLYVGANKLSQSKLAIRETIDGKVNVQEDAIGLKVGDTGSTISTLRPEGYALFRDDKIIVWAFSGYIEADTKIEIAQIRDNKIYVKTAG